MKDITAPRVYAGESFVMLMCCARTGYKSPPAALTDGGGHYLMILEYGNRTPTILLGGLVSFGGGVKISRK